MGKEKITADGDCRPLFFFANPFYIEEINYPYLLISIS